MSNAVDSDRLARNIQRMEAQGATDDDIREYIDQEMAAANPPTQRLRTIAQGASFGGADELEAGVRSIFSDRPYREIRDEIRGDLSAYREANPLESLGYEVGGGLLTGGIGGAKAFGMGLLRNFGPTARFMTIGAGEGALAGAGYAPELEDLPTAVPVGAGMGTATGLIAGGLSALAARLLQGSPATKAGRIVQQALRRGDIDADEAVRRLNQLGEEGMLADISPATRAVTRKVAAETGPGRTIVAEALNQRQAGMLGRINRQMGPEDFNRYLDDIAEARRMDAKPFYQSAYQGRIDPTRNMKIARNSPEGRSAWKEARQRYMNENLFDEADMEGIDLEIQPEMWDRWARRLSGIEGKAMRSGDNEAARYIGNMRRLANDDIYKQLPDLKEARRISGGRIRMDEAAQEGRKIFSGNADEVERLMRDMGMDELEAYRQGAIRAVTDKLERSVDDANAARNLIKTERVRKLLRATFPDGDAGQSQYDDFINMLQSEARMGETFSSINRGSRTAFVEAEKGDFGPVNDALRSLLQGDMGTAARSGWRALTGGGSPNYPDPLSRELGGLLTRQGQEAQTGLMGLMQSGTPDSSALSGLLAPAIQQEQQTIWE